MEDQVVSHFCNSYLPTFLQNHSRAGSLLAWLDCSCIPHNPLWHNFPQCRCMHSSEFSTVCLFRRKYKWQGCSHVWRKEVVVSQIMIALRSEIQNPSADITLTSCNHFLSWCPRTRVRQPVWMQNALWTPGIIWMPIFLFQYFVFQTHRHVANWLCLKVLVLTPLLSGILLRIWVMWCLPDFKDCVLSLDAYCKQRVLILILSLSPVCNCNFLFLLRSPLGAWDTPSKALSKSSIGE